MPFTSEDILSEFVEAASAGHRREFYAEGSFYVTRWDSMFTPLGTDYSGLAPHEKRDTAYARTFRKKHPDRIRKWARQRYHRKKTDPVFKAKRAAKYKRYVAAHPEFKAYASEKNRLYYARLKADPVRYAKHLEKRRKREETPKKPRT